MHYLIFPKQDAWIYSKFPTLNYGLDEILEIRNESMVEFLQPPLSSSDPFILTASFIATPSRILIQFNTASFSSVAIASASTYYLNLYAANPLDLSDDYTVQAFAVSSSWVNGTGFPAQTTQRSDGVCWYSILCRACCEILV